MHVVDARGLSCPEPVLLTKKAIDSNLHASFKVLVDGAAAWKNIASLAKTQGWSVNCEQKTDQYELTLQK
jgi:tRNA 2-thiouridine synthesizing protein A